MKLSICTSNIYLSWTAYVLQTWKKWRSWRSSIAENSAEFGRFDEECLIMSAEKQTTQQTNFITIKSISILWKCYEIHGWIAINFHLRSILWIMPHSKFHNHMTILSEKKKKNNVYNCPKNKLLFARFHYFLLRYLHPRFYKSEEERGLVVT